MTDERIVALFWERSETAIAETDTAYGHYFHYIAFGILGSDEDAKEIVNDTYLKAWNTIPPQRPNHLKAFLGRITRQLSINRLEHNSAQKRAGSQYQFALDNFPNVLPKTRRTLPTPLPCGIPSINSCTLCPSTRGGSLSAGTGICIPLQKSPPASP